LLGRGNTLATKPQNSICAAIDVLKRYMERKDFSISNGKIFKRIKESRYTSTYCCSVKDFLMNSLADAELANVLVPHISAIENLLSNPSCRLIKPIVIDHNLIEVLPPNTCFKISLKKFIQIEEMPLNTSPRAFVRYTYQEDRVPYPKPFVEGKY